MKRITLLLFLMSLLPGLCFAGPHIPGFYGKAAPSLPSVAPNALPVPKAFIQGVDRLVEVPGGNKAILYQNQPKAIIDWNTFNIGKDAWMHFDQQGNSNWAALNRIWDRNPSQIFGRMTADGQVYLINQNGILFGPDSKVNVHSLIASSLNLTNSDFLQGLLRFRAENYNGLADSLFYDPLKNLPGPVSNHGTMDTKDLGSVFLIGPLVENSGTIISPSGQIGLAAGTDVELALPLSGDAVLQYPGGESRTSLVIRMNNSPVGSAASNMAGGLLAADTGVVGMYGRIVNQDGLIRSVTAVERGGHVELFASERISTGPGSWIATPVSGSSEKVHISFPTARSDVTFSGLDPEHPDKPRRSVNRIEHQGWIDAPCGWVTLNAVERVYLESGSRIDVSGLWIAMPGNAGLLSVQMNSVNLKDDFMQKGGVLQGKTIHFSSASGSSIGDVSGAYTTEGLTALERHTGGRRITVPGGDYVEKPGSITINVAGLEGSTERVATGDVIVREGAVIDFSGVGFRFGAGSMDSTALALGNRVYDISTADPKLRYDKVLNLQQVRHSRYGISESFEGLYYGGAFPLNQYVQQRVIGSDAGSLALLAKQVVLDGTIRGQVEKGLTQYLTAEPVNAMGYQTRSGYVEPVGGGLTIANTFDRNISGYGDQVDFFVQEMRISANVSPLPSHFLPTDALPTSKTILPAQTLSAAGLSNVVLAANTGITVDPGARVNLRPGGTFSARARRIEHYGEINVPGGSISLSIETNKTTNPITLGDTNPSYLPLDERIYLAAGSRLVAAGERIDNT
ncbi:MAG: filamentous hemagglutinin N-terminal domain-containing protein, partial [Syntrophaceae bacterium]|nr:filamentous hemagglutinin N-terminal domain-containing protein [Syntrophaceae bacterium]